MVRVLALLLCTAPSQPNPFLAQAKVHFMGLEYDRCLRRLEQATHWSSTPQETVEIELYGGLCSFYQGREAEAEKHFRVALELDRDAKLPPHTSPRVRELFDSLSRQAQPLPSPTPPADAPKLPTKIEPVSPAPPARTPPTVPFVLGGVALAFSGVGAAFGVSAKQHEAASDTRFEQDSRNEGIAARADATRANLAYGAAAAAGVAAVVTYFLWRAEMSGR